MTNTQQKVHKLLQLAMECDSHCVSVQYSNANQSVYMHVYDSPYEPSAPIIHSDHAYVDNMLGDADEALDRMIKYVETLS